MSVPAIKGPKRGVSIYSYSGEWGITMNLEDCFKDIYDMGATGVEILANGHIENYPQPTNEWMDNWFRLCTKYNITPVEYGHWVTSRLYRGEMELNTEESVAMLKRDITLAHRLGFTVLRTKLGVIDWILTPVRNWREIILGALDLAERYGVCMCPEIHQPTALSSKMVQEYVEFIDKYQTNSFGLNIDFGVFQNKWTGFKMPGLPEDGSPCSYPSELKALMPYIHACHAKFNNMSEDFQETTIPYEEILKEFVDAGWDGYLLSEYEGAHKDEPGFVSEQLKRQHIMMKRILGY